MRCGSPTEHDSSFHAFISQAAKPNTLSAADPHSGMWRYRYGLFESDDEDDELEAMQESTPPQPSKDVNGNAAKGAPPKQGYGLFDEDEDMDDDLGSDQTGWSVCSFASLLYTGFSSLLSTEVVVARLD